MTATSIDADGNVQFDTPEVQAAYGWVKELVEFRLRARPASPSTRPATPWRRGRAGFIFEGPWGRGLFNNLSGGKLTTAADGDIWAAPMPNRPVGQAAHDRQPPRDHHLLRLRAQGARGRVHPPRDLRSRVTDAYFDASKQLSTGNMELLTSGMMGDDAYTQIFVQALPDTNDNPIKSPKFYAVMDDLVVALQSIIQGGDIEDELANAERKAQRTLSR